MLRLYLGFTLVELMVTLAVVAILASLATPSFQTLIAEQKIKTTASKIQSFLLLARSEALKRNTNITLQPALAGQWNTGWNIVNQATTTTLFNAGPVETVSITGPSSIIYQGTGRVQASSSSNFKLSSSGTSRIRCIEINLSGMPVITSSGC